MKEKISWRVNPLKREEAKRERGGEKGREVRMTSCQRTSSKDRRHKWIMQKERCASYCMRHKRIKIEEKLEAKDRKDVR